MDGVCIGVQEYRCETSINPKTTFKGESVEVNMGKLERTRFAHTVAIQKKLISFVVTQTGNFRRDCRIEKLETSECERLLDWGLKEPRYNSFFSFCVWCSRIDDDKSIPESLLFFFCFFCFFCFWFAFFACFLLFVCFACFFLLCCLLLPCFVLFPKQQILCMRFFSKKKN